MNSPFAGLYMVLIITVFGGAWAIWQKSKLDRRMREESRKDEAQDHSIHC